ncbi:MFS transporter [Cellulomonas hominis]|uniref:MFS transporter n=1 Tax=Cellulomonas hominis TaxID=156981 RepID=UPI001BD1ADF1|nr:MFS transporter [Cellulomonas hominis]
MPLSQDGPTPGAATREDTAPGGSAAPGTPARDDRLPLLPASPLARAGLLALLAVVVAQAATAAVIPAASRSLGLPDWQAGAVTSASAAVVVLTSPAWGRRAGVRGSRRVVLVGVLGALLGTAGVAATLAAADVLDPGPAWVALLLARGVVLGTAVAAVGPAVQVQLVAVSRSEGDRVAWIARAGAVRSVATMAGAGLAAALGAVAAGLPVLAAAAVLAVAGVVALTAGRRDARPAEDAGPPDVDAPADPDGPADRAPVLPAFATLRRAGVRAAVLASAGVFLAMALVQGSVGFLAQDRYDLAAGPATALTGALLLAAGLGSLVAQGLLVPRLRWRPWRLVRWGGAVVVAAVAVYAVPVPRPVLLAVALVFGVGVGAAAAGCTAAASTAVGAAEQGEVAGLVNAVNALTFVVGPALAAASYGWHPVVPAALALAAGSAAVLVRPGAVTGPAA